MRQKTGKKSSNIIFAFKKYLFIENNVSILRYDYIIALLQSIEPAPSFFIKKFASGPT